MENTSSIKWRTGRAGLLTLAIASLLTGLWGGLLRVPVSLPLPVDHANWMTFHGPMMVCGFLGTLISLERAVGLCALWTYLAPVLTGAGAMAISGGALGEGPRWTLVAGSAVFTAVCGRIISLQPALHTVVIGLGALSWLGGNLLWAMGSEIPAVTPWWVGFPLLTILGERLELTRFQRPSKWAQPSLIASVLVLATGLGTTPFAPRWGGMWVGLAMLALGLWLLRFDLARRTIRHAGLPRFMACCLLSGYAWLVVAGLLVARTWPQATGFYYDAALHAFFVGFVFAMILAHAPVIFPAVLGLPVGFRWTSYMPLVVLHASLLLRFIADLARWTEGRAWGAAGNGVALALFLLTTVLTILLGQHQRARVG